MKPSIFNVLERKNSVLSRKVEEELKNSKLVTNYKTHYFPSKQILPQVKALKSKYFSFSV